MWKWIKRNDEMIALSLLIVSLIAAIVAIANGG